MNPHNNLSHFTCEALLATAHLSLLMTIFLKDLLENQSYREKRQTDGHQQPELSQIRARSFIRVIHKGTFTWGIFHCFSKALIMDTSLYEKLVLLVAAFMSCF